MTKMKNLFTAALLASALALPALTSTSFAALKPPSMAPEFAAPASLAGKEFKFDLADALKKGPVVVYFYPSAYTQGCNIEAHTFAENADAFAAVNTTIIGVSHDSIARLNDYSADPDYCAGKFPVASDPDGAIAKSYDLSVRAGREGMKDSRGNEIDHAFTERTTFVIKPGGEIVATLSSAEDKVTPVEHVEKSLAIVKEMSAK
ncbi:MAG: peroxiredoxin [Rhodobacteraceae bacterium]|nr:peroxiredoxin [Paracoccaceae bacterium]